MMRRLTPFILFTFYQIAHAQTACQFFSSADNNYTAWSENHIATWCKDHDPSSTSQCATVVWPPYIRYPSRAKLHRNFKEWFLQMNPSIGTRRDCIARSAALGINSTTRQDGIFEAVTCDLYNFHPERINECVCYPIYHDHVTKVSTLVHDVYKVIETTSVFYPPEQVVESYLLAAATQGPPSTCHSAKSACSKSVEVVARKPRTLGGFPYCPTPGRRARQYLPARTPRPINNGLLWPTRSTNTWGPLPTAAGVGGNGTKLEKAQYKNDQCVWQFLQPWKSPLLKTVTFSGTRGAALFVTHYTEYINMTEPHWGYIPTPIPDPAKPDTTTRGKSKAETTIDSSRLLSAESHLRQLGLTEYLTPTPTSTTLNGYYCRDEIDCREWCDEQGKKQFKRLLGLGIAGSVVSALAILGILWKKNYERRHGHEYKNRAIRFNATEKDSQPDSGLVQGLELVRTQTETAGGKGKGKVRFQADGADSLMNFAGSSNDVHRGVSEHGVYL